MDLLVRQDVVSSNPTRTALKTLYGPVSQMRGCEFKFHQNCNETRPGPVSQMSDCEFESHQNCSENFINLLDARL